MSPFEKWIGGFLKIGRSRGRVGRDGGVSRPRLGGGCKRLSARRLQLEPLEERRLLAVWVNPDGSADYTTIQAAIDDVSAGETINVEPATYTEDLTIGTANLTLRTTGAGVTIDGTIQNGGNAFTVDVAGTAAEITGEISGGGGLTKAGSGTLTLSGTSSHAGATNVNAGRLNVNGATDPASTITVASGATLGGTGTAAGQVNVQGGTVAPGLSPGILSTGNLKFADGSTFEVEIGGTTPGAHDQLDVTGTVTIGNNVALNVSAFGGFEPSPSNEFVLIANDHKDTVTGTFNGLDEGATVSTNFLSSGHTARITYAGGDGNDVSIVVDGPLDFEFPDNNVPYTVKLVGLNFQILDAADNVLKSVPFEGVTSATIKGKDEQDDTLVVDFVGGSPIPPGGLAFNGGDVAGSDSLELRNVSTTFGRHTYTYDDGSIVLIEGATDSRITFTGLESLKNDGTADYIIFNLPAGGNPDAVLEDVAGEGRLSGSTFEDTNFAYPAAGGSMTINMGSGDDTLAVKTLALNADTDLILDGQGGADTLTVDLGGGMPIPTGGLTFDGGDGSDELKIANGSLNTLKYEVGQDKLVLDEDYTINFTGLEPITVTSSVATVIVEVNDTADNTTEFTADGDSTKVTAGGFEPMTFGNPSAGLIVNGDDDNNDTITFSGLGAGFDAAITVDGRGGETDTLCGPDLKQTWKITGSNAGELDGAADVDFSNVENLNGGSKNDDFVFDYGGSLSGGVDGRDGDDTLTVDMNDGPNQVRIDQADIYADSHRLTGYADIKTIEVNTKGGNDQVCAQLPLSGSMTVHLDGGPDVAILDRFKIVGSDETDKVLVLDPSTPPRSALESLRDKHPKVFKDEVAEAYQLFRIKDISSLQLFGGGGEDWLVNYTTVPSLIDGANGDDVLSGGDAAEEPKLGDPDPLGDVIFGGDGADTLLGNAGNDFLFADHEYNDGEPIETRADDDKADGRPGVDTVVALGRDLADGDADDELIINGAELTVLAWLMATFPEPSPGNIKAALKKALDLPWTEPFDCCEDDPPVVSLLGAAADPIGFGNPHGIDLGRIDFVDLAGQALIDGQRWYRLEPVRDGILTAEATGDAGDLQLTLYIYDDDGQAQQLASGYIRLDFEQAVMGQEYYLGVAGPGTNFDLRLANLVSQEGGEVAVYGTSADNPYTSGEDQFELDASASRQITINAVGYHFEDAEAGAVTFDGGEGQDTAVVEGTEGQETATLWPGGGRVVGDGYTVTVVNAESIRVTGGGGPDVAKLYDDPGSDDTLVATPKYATLFNDAFSNQAVGFPHLHAYSTAGNQDVAKLYDDPGSDDTLVATPDYGVLLGGTFHNRAVGFRYLHAYGTEGNQDVAKLYDDPAGDDTLVATPDYGVLFSGAFRNRAVGFRYLHAYSTAGNQDVAKLYDDPSSDDTLVATPDYGVLLGAAFHSRSVGFRYLHAYSTAGNQDVARLYDDPAGDDTLVATPDCGVLLGAAFHSRAVGFRYLQAYASGGADVATVYDSPGDDTLVGTTGYGRLLGDEFYIAAFCFDQGYAVAEDHDDADEADVAPDAPWIMLGDWESP